MGGSSCDLDVQVVVGERRSDEKSRTFGQRRALAASKAGGAVVRRCYEVTWFHAGLHHSCRHSAGAPPKKFEDLETFHVATSTLESIHFDHEWAGEQPWSSVMGLPFIHDDRVLSIVFQILVNLDPSYPISSHHHRAEPNTVQLRTQLILIQVSVKHSIKPAFALLGRLLRWKVVLGLQGRRIIGSFWYYAIHGIWSLALQLGTRSRVLCWPGRAGLR